MSLVVIGLNHHSAPLELLEQVTVAAEELPKALHDLKGRPHISEAVVLSTCNRTEIYVIAEKFHGAFQDVRDFLAEWSTASQDRIGDALYTFYEIEAVEHLFRVSAGVDSAVIGEHEMALHMRHLLEQAGQELPESRPSLEVNLEHPLLARMEQAEDASFDDLAHILYEQAVLAEGGQLDDPVGFVTRLNEVMLTLGQE